MEKSVIKLINKKSLSIEESKQLLKDLLTQKFDDQEKNKILKTLFEKPESIDEVVGFTLGMFEAMIPFNVSKKAIDICGTGGSGKIRFNISTAVAFLLASMKIPIIKHGNKGSKSPNGSFDFLEELNIPIDLNLELQKKVFKKFKLSFLFARQYHPAVKNVANARASLTHRSIFNLIGPLSNPSKVDYQIIGTPDEKTALILAEALKKLKKKRAVVVNGFNNIDEVSIDGSSQCFLITKDTISKFTINPKELGIKGFEKDDYIGGTAKENANYFKKLLDAPNDSDPILNMICLNAALALFCYENKKQVSEYFSDCKKILLSGQSNKFFINYINYIKKLTIPNSDSKKIHNLNHQI